MISDDDDFKAGLEMAKEAEKRAARPATKRAAPKSAKKAVKAKKPVAKKAVTRKPGAHKTTAKETAPNAITKTAYKAAPKAAKPAVNRAPAVAFRASADGWEAGYEAWAATGLKARDACFETGRLAVTTALEFGRRNLAFQRELLAKGLELGRDLRP